MCAPQHGVKCL